MASLLAFSLVCLALLTVMIGIASLGLVLFVLLRDALFPLPTSSIAHPQAHVHPHIIESKSQEYFDSVNEQRRKNPQIYPLNSDEIINLDDDGMHKMQQKRSLRSAPVQSDVDVSSIVTEKTDETEAIPSGRQTSDDKDDNDNADNDMDMHQSHSDASKQSDSPSTSSLNTNHPEHSIGDLSSNMKKPDSIERITEVERKTDAEERRQVKRQSEQMTVDETSNQPKTTTMLTEVTLTIEPPFEKIILQPLCPLNGAEGC